MPKRRDPQSFVSYAPPAPGAQWGVFVCTSCRDTPDDETTCGDHCGHEWADEMGGLGADDYWPECSCCGRVASLLAPLVRLPL